MSFQPILSPGQFAPTLIGGASQPLPRREDPAEADPGVAVDLESQLSAVAAQTRAAVEAEMAEERERLQAAFAHVQQVAAALEDAQHRLAEESRQQVGELVIAALRRLVGEVSVLRDAALREAIEEAAGRLVGEQEVLVRVSPTQQDFARELIAERSGWSVRADESVSGGVRVEIAHGSLDASLSAALDGICAAVEAWKKESR